MPQRRRAPATQPDPLLAELVREIENYTIAQIAEDSGYSYSSIEQLRYARHMPKYAFVRDLADALGFKLVLVRRGDWKK
jgi:transcriptional regulator with XRE-family HTH domain